MTDAQGGKKLDTGKAQHDLLPYEALDEIAKVLTFGCKKYSRSDWAKGLKISRFISATYRHLGQFNNGEDIDPESQTLHIANAATNLMMAIWMLKNRPDMDDRWIKSIKKQEV